MGKTKTVVKTEKTEDLKKRLVLYLKSNREESKKLEIEARFCRDKKFFKQARLIESRNRGLTSAWTAINNLLKAEGKEGKECQ